MTTDQTFERIEVTPEKAAEWLDRCNKGNRPMSTRRVEQMARDMRNGEWRVTPDLVAFDVNDVLMNGQNRLAAVAKAGVTIPMWIMRGLPTDSFQVTDDVKRRSLSDYLSIQGVPSYAHVASLTTRLYYLQRTGRPHQTGVMSTTSDLINFYRTLEVAELTAAVNAGRNISKNVGSNATGCAVGYYITNTVDPEDAEAFPEQLRFGTDQGMVFRETMLRDRAASHPTVSTSPEIVAAYYIKTWNAWRSASDLKLLKYRRGGAKPESFPVAI